MPAAARRAPVEPGVGEQLQARLLGHDHADPAPAALDQMGGGQLADLALVHDEGVRALDALRARG